MTGYTHIVYTSSDREIPIKQETHDKLIKAILEGEVKFVDLEGNFVNVKSIEKIISI